MRKGFTKIICLIAVVIFACFACVVSACSKDFKADPLSGDTSGEVTSNGGFAAGKGDYIYFINGDEENTADNSWGVPVKGTIMRISRSDLAARNYSSVQTVVPLIAYSGNSNGGLFIYGDYIYYTSPSTTRDSDGNVNRTSLDFRRTKLDGTGTSSSPIATSTNSSVEYTFTEVGDTVYLMYVATSEDLYGTGTSVSNLHSVNCETGENTLLAYDVQSVVFDTENRSNARAYYTMNVPKLSEGGEETAYNQVYCVTADETVQNEYDFSEVDGYDAEKDPVYLNCGDLILDGRGAVVGELTQFNLPADPENPISNQPYTYTLSAYKSGVLFYTRTSSGDSHPVLMSVGDASVPADKLANESFTDAAQPNPATENGILRDADVSSFTYIVEEGALSGVFSVQSDGIKYLKTEGGKLPQSNADLDPEHEYYITGDTGATVLTLDGDYLYYSVSDGIKRVNYKGGASDYQGMPSDDEGNEYIATAILDIDATSGWYSPEIFDGQLLYATEISDDAQYTYVCACDLRNSSGKVMDNTELKAYNERFDSIDGEDGKIAELSKDYSETCRNLETALRYAYVTRADDTLIKARHEEFKEWVEDYAESDSGYTDETIVKYNEFLTATGDWADFNDTRDINGEKVFANTRDYYYTALGRMSDADAKDYADFVADSYLQKATEPEKQPTWFEGLSSGAKAGFIIGIIAAGLIVIAAAAVTAGLIIHKKQSTPTQRVRRIRVDTTDDKNIDVYSDMDADSADSAENADGGDVAAEEEAEQPAEQTPEESAEQASEEEQTSADDGTEDKN